MKVLIVHLSDIHFRTTQNPIMDKAEALSRAAKGAALSTNANVCLLIVSGDIAFSGRTEEYGQARSFFSTLTSQITSGDQALTLHTVMVPGNHDCNFEAHTQAREAMIRGIPSSIDRIGQSDTSIVDVCVAVQEQFFRFARELQPNIRIDNSNQKLRYSIREPICDMSVCVECYNTSWLSQHTEVQGQLFFPHGLLYEKRRDADLVLSVFHHPYPWLNADNRKAFQRHVEKHSDIILTGHEHDGDIYRKSSLHGEGVYFVEGSVLQTNNPIESGFNILVVDLDQKEWIAREYGWNDSEKLYRISHESTWQPFVQKRTFLRHEFVNNTQYADFLNDPGTIFTHPKAKILRLPDLFVYPDLYALPIEKQTREPIYSGDAKKYLMKHKRILIVGTERSGKTTLAKALYSDLQREGIVPLLISGRALRKPDEKSVLDVIRREFIEQYEERLLDKYEQQARSSKALIIDDFHRTRFNEKAANQLFNVATRLFDRVIVIVDDIYELSSVERREGKPGLLLDFQHCELREFGHAARGELIRKWLTIGEDYATDEEEIAYKIAKAEKDVDTLLGRNLIPRYPLFVLTVLQLIESNTNLKMMTGSYGYIYEALITAALSTVGKGTSLDIKYAYISHIAYRMFSMKKTLLRETELEEVGQRYYDRHKIRISTSAMIRDLEKASILHRVGVGFVFKHGYLYPYFVAKYFQDNLASNDADLILKQVLGLIEQVHTEDAANILIFFLYLTKHPQTVEQLLLHGKQIFHESEPCDLDADVQWLLEPEKEPLKFAYEGGDKAQSKQKYLRAMDETEDRFAKPQTDNDSTEARETQADGNGSQASTINVAMKTLGILGQIIRNFPGSLRGDIKRAITHESYLLGLRTLTAILQSLERNKSEFHDHLKEVLRSKKKFSDEKELDQRTDQFIYLLVLGLAFSIMKKISYSVGSSELEETYKELLNENSENIPFKLIDMSIQLDHFRPTPADAIVKLNDSLRGKPFAEFILRALVFEHIDLYPVKERIVQRLCKKLGIVIHRARALEAKGKK